MYSTILYYIRARVCSIVVDNDLENTYTQIYLLFSLLEKS